MVSLPGCPSLEHDFSAGKILRNVMAAMAAGQPHRLPPTIDDPSVLPELEALFHAQLHGH
jgi:hypothetical protein